MNIEPENTVIELQCNVDDMTGEAVAYAVEKLAQAGAADVSWQPIGMKKGRPGYLLTVVCTQDRRQDMLAQIFRHTTTIGIRETVCRRYILKRKNEIIETHYGPVRVKHSTGYGVTRRKAEFEDLRSIADKHGLILDEIRTIAELASAQNID